MLKVVILVVVELKSKFLGNIFFAQKACFWR